MEERIARNPEYFSANLLLKIKKLEFQEFKTLSTVPEFQDKDGKPFFDIDSLLFLQVLQQSFKCGLIHNFGKDYKAEPCDLFFLGGPLTLRGFQQDGIGPQVDGYFLGAPVSNNFLFILYVYPPSSFNVAQH